MSDFNSIIAQDSKPERKAFQWIIWGDAKVGKTTLASRFPAPVLIDIEGGAEFIDIPRFRLKQYLKANKGDAMAAVIAFATSIAAGGKYKTVIIDTLDELWNVISFPMKKNGMLSQNAYQPLYDQIRIMLATFRTLGLELVMTSHSKAETDDDGVRFGTSLALPGKLAPDVAGRVDELLYLTIKSKPGAEGEADKRVRYLVCQPTHHRALGLINAGDRSGALPDYIEDPTFDDLSVVYSAKPGLFDGNGNAKEDKPKVSKGGTRREAPPEPSKGDENAEPGDDFFSQPEVTP